MDMGFSCRKNAFFRGAHKIGAAISGPRIAGKKNNGHEALKTLTSLNKEVRPFFLSDNSIWSFPSVSSLGDYSIWRS